MLAAKKTAAILGLALFAAIVGSEVRIFAQRTEPVEARQPDEPDVLAVAQEALKNEEPKDERLDRFGDRLPVGAIARLGTLRFRHSHFVSGLAYTPDGKSLASACWDGAVRLWDAETGKMTRSFQHDPDRQTFTLVAITPDGKTLVNIEGGASVRIWDLESGKERRSMKLGNGFALALSHDGKIVAKGVSGADNKKQQVLLWDVETGKLIRTLGASNRTAGALAFSGDGKLLAAGDSFPGGKEEAASSVRLWDPISGRLVHELKGHTGGVTAVAFSRDSKLVASASHDGTIRLWGQDGELVRTIAVPADPSVRTPVDRQLLPPGIRTGGVLAVAFSPDGRWVASGSFDGNVRLWDAATGKGLHTMPGHGREVTSVVFSPDGKVLASASYDHTIRLWDPVTGKDHQPRQGHHGPVQAIAVSRDGKTAAAACWYRAVHLWSLESGAQLQELRGHMENIFSVAFSPDGRSVASGSADETIRIWDVATGREVRQLLGHKRFVNSIAFTPVESMLISAGGDRTVRFWDWSSARELRQIKTDGNSQMSISRDGRIVGALGEQATIWDVASGKELRRSPGQFALAPDGRTFVTQASDGLIRQWNIATGEQQIAFPGPTYSESWRGPVGLVLSPDSRLLAGRHGTGIGIWELATGKVRRQLDNHQGGIVPFVFSPDGRTMLTGGEDTTILIWDLARRHEIRPAQLAPADLDALWRDLGGDDPERADRAIGALAARADQSVPFLKKHLRPAIAPDPKRLRALITDLDSDQFAVRDKAFKELQGERDLATAALREALDKPPSLESRRRIEDLLARQCVVLTAGDLLQSVRAVEVLERIDNLDARKLLQKLASGAAHARLSQEALDALSRLGPQ